MKQQQPISTLGKIYIGILLVIFGGIVLHAPLSVGLGTLWPNYDLLIKSWKEILMLIAGILVVFLIFKTKQTKLFHDPIIIAIAVYATLHVLLLFYMPQGLTASLAGLAMDLRYILFFALVYLAMRLYPDYRPLFLRVGIAGSLVVMVFAVLQVLILPHDILKYIGYSANTIKPYLTVDKNPDYIRINSTLRGPNSVGAYAVMVLTLISAAFAKHKLGKDKRSLILAVILAVGGIVALWASYSRSALVAMVVAVGTVLATVGVRKLSAKKWIIAGAILVTAMSGLILVGGSTFVSNFFLHENPSNVSSTNSNEGHIASLETGLKSLVSQPLGAGIGSTGSASLYTNSPLIIENQYLYIAHEVGWLGLTLFIAIFATVLIKLWDKRKDWFALGVFASGIGIALIAIVLPILADDTISIVWWGLAALAIFPVNKDIIKS